MTYVLKTKTRFIDLGNIKKNVFEKSEIAGTEYILIAHRAQMAHNTGLASSIKHVPNSGYSIRLKTQTELDMKNWAQTALISSSNSGHHD